MKIKQIFGFFVGWFLSLNIVGQTYPVDAGITLTPPYSLYLSDYTALGSQKMGIHLYLRNLDRVNYPVKLRITIEGQNVILQTREGFSPTPIYLQGGLLQMLSGQELEPYLNPNNLTFSGFSQEAYTIQQKLPEGIYRFCVEVLDYTRQVPVSRKACATAWMILNDPPLINRPYFGEKLLASDPQQVFFQWTPRHTASPNAAFSVEYELSVVEIWPSDRNPNDAMNTTNPIFRTIITETQLAYGIAEPLLIPGRSYAFRVRAIDTEGLDIFKNDGYSEVGMFVYGDDCPIPGGVEAEVLNPEAIKVQWMLLEGQTAFVVNYREHNKPSAHWFEEEVFSAYKNINSLKPQTTYEYQVKAKCGTVSSAHTSLSTIQTPPRNANEFVCGSPTAPFLENSTMKVSLQEGDVVMAGDFDVQLTKVNGMDGIFSGEGLVVIPFMDYVKVRTIFTNITVNEDNRMINGSIKIIGTTISVLDEETRNQIRAVLDQVDQAFETIDQALNVAEVVLEKLEEVVDFMEDLPEHAQNAINEGKSLIEQGKALLASGDESGMALLQQGAQMIQEGLDAVEEVMENLEKYFDSFVDMVKSILSEEQEIAEEKKTAGEVVRLEKEEAYEQLRATYNAERGDLMDNSLQVSPSHIIAFSVVEANANGMENYTADQFLSDLENAVKAYQEAEQFINDAYLIAQHIEALFHPGKMDAFLDDLKKDAEQAGMALLENFLNGGISNEQELKSFLENYIQDYLQNKLVELRSKS